MSICQICVENKNPFYWLWRSTALPNIFPRSWYAQRKDRVVSAATLYITLYAVDAITIRAARTDGYIRSEVGLEQYTIYVDLSDGELTRKDVFHITVESTNANPHFAAHKVPPTDTNFSRLLHFDQNKIPCVSLVFSIFFPVFFSALKYYIYFTAHGEISLVLPVNFASSLCFQNIKIPCFPCAVAIMAFYSFCNFLLEHKLHTILQRINLKQMLKWYFHL